MYAIRSYYEDNMQDRKSGGHTKKILVVDDQRSQLKLMKKMLEKIGYMAVTVDSAEEAEYILRRNNFV